MHVSMQLKKSHTLISLGMEDPSGKEGTFLLFESKFVTDLKWDLGQLFWGGQEPKFRSPSTTILIISNIGLS